MSDYLYHYRAVVRSQYDGDTWRLDIDLGFGIWMRNQSVRLYGIDTPELRGESRERGLEVRDRVRGMWPEGTEVTIQTLKDKTGKYGRWLAIIWPDNLTISANKYLLNAGMAVERWADG